MKSYTTLPKTTEEFITRLKEGGRLCAYIVRVLVDANVVKREKKFSPRQYWYDDAALASETITDFRRLEELLTSGHITGYRNFGEDSFEFLKSVYPCVPRKIKRATYTCTHCEGVYTDAPVSQCDCTVGVEKQSFVKGYCVYTLPAVK